MADELIKRVVERGIQNGLHLISEENINSEILDTRDDNNHGKRYIAGIIPGVSCQPVLSEFYHKIGTSEIPEEMVRAKCLLEVVFEEGYIFEKNLVRIVDNVHEAKEVLDAFVFSVFDKDYLSLCENAKELLAINLMKGYSFDRAIAKAKKGSGRKI